MRSTAAIIAVCSVVAAASYVRSTGAAGARWDAAPAARYLDSRMDLWWTNAKVLQTGDSQARCVSCHTAVPYALARPALRRALGETTPTPHEARILETAQRRVASLGNEEPFYTQSEDKKVESAGVEAVLNAFVLTNHDVDVKATEPSAATKAAMAQLWHVQREDGAWNWLNFGLEPYEAPDAVFHGATLAAMAAGTAPGKQASTTAEGQSGSTRLRAYLHGNVGTQRLFNRAWALLAASRLDGVLTSDQREAIVRDLQSRQRPDGGWSLVDMGTWRWNGQDAPFSGPGETDRELLSAADGYATGLAVYALRQAGIAADNPAVAGGQAWLRSHEVPEAAAAAWAPWRAHSLNFDREHGGPKGEPWRRMFMSDLATAFAALALS